MSEAESIARAVETKRSVRNLKLFLANGEPNSLAAQENLAKLMRMKLDCEIIVESVDVLKDYRSALEHRVLVTPCLVLLDPPPQVMIAGTLKDLEKVLTALRVRVGNA